MKKVINNYFLLEKSEIAEQIKKNREENKKFMLYVYESKKDLILTNKQDDILEDPDINYIFCIHSNNIINRGFKHITQKSYKDKVIFKNSSIEENVDMFFDFSPCGNTNLNVSKPASESDFITTSE